MDVYEYLFKCEYDGCKHAKRFFDTIRQGGGQFIILPPYSTHEGQQTNDDGHITAKLIAVRIMNHQQALCVLMIESKSIF
jgi:hypothetical protein